MHFFDFQLFVKDTGGVFEQFLDMVGSEPGMPQAAPGPPR